MAGLILGEIIRLSASPIIGAPAAGFVLGAIMSRDIQDGGNGVIEGTITINTVPGSRRVRLFDARSGRLIRETWSAANGAYAFQHIDRARDYFVLAHDYLEIYNAVVADNVTPDPM